MNITKEGIATSLLTAGLGYMMFRIVQDMMLCYGVIR